MKHVHLRTARERKHLTQAQLEAATITLGHKVSQVTISRLESDPNAAALFDTVTTLADALEMDPRELKFGPDPKTTAAA